jgi:hypothetical protein
MTKEQESIADLVAALRFVGKAFVKLDPSMDAVDFATRLEPLLRRVEQRIGSSD